MEKVSIIIPVFNDEKRLEKCLDALDRQTYANDCYEVIVVDNASTADFKSLVARFRQARYCYEGKQGSYAARNKGLSVATGDVIAFTDSDCIPALNWIERGVSTLRQIPDCGLVGGAITIFVKDPKRPSGVEIYESFKGFPQKEYIEKSQFGATANVFTSRKIIDAVGYFDSELKSGGDAEWGKRVSKAGYRLRYAADVEVRHPARSTYAEYYRKTIRVLSGLPAYRNPGPVSLFVIIRRLLGGIKPPVSRIRRTLAESGVEGVEQKLKLAMFDLFLHYVWLFEGARLKYKNKE